MSKSVTIAGSKFAALRIERYLTQEEFASRLQMSPGNVRRLEQSETGGMQVKNFRRLAELLEITPDELRVRIGVESSGDRSVAGASPQPAALRRGSLQPAAEIEQFHGVSAARPEERPEVDRGRTSVPPGSPRRFSATVDGDCMEPKYRHGDVVIFSVEAAEREGIIDGRNYFLQLASGENTFKRLFLDPDDRERLILRCWNEAYPDRTIDRKDVKLLARAIYRQVPDE